MTVTDHNAWVRASGSLATGDWSAVIDASIAGWSHTGLRVAELAGGAVVLAAEREERMVIPLHGDVSVEWELGAESGSFALAGRASVFHGPADSASFPPGTRLTLSGSGRVAVASAPVVASDLRPTVLRADAVSVELRGAGTSSRQVHGFGMPGGLPAQRLLVCEVITPAGNWSSYPAHKHDTAVPGVEAELEEIYYFEAAPTRGAEAGPEADPFGLFATSGSAAGDIDTTVAVRTGDVALVPYGYHGPAVAAPGYDLYYLNVMAGAGEREWLATDDPHHAWIRASWVGQHIDPRLPFEQPREA